MALTVSKLPNVIADMIFEFVGAKSDDDFHQVCKSWNDLFNRVKWVQFEKHLVKQDEFKQQWWEVRIRQVREINASHAFSAIFRDLMNCFMNKQNLFACMS